MTRRWYLGISAALLVLVAGCGSSGPTASDQIAAIVKSEGSNPASLCRHLSDSLAARLGGRSACLRQASAAARDPSTHATAIRVHGNTATAVVIDRTGTSTISLFKDKGAWKISAVR
jgi:hypothetical protein